MRSYVPLLLWCLRSLVFAYKVNITALDTTTIFAAREAKSAWWLRGPHRIDLTVSGRRISRATRLIRRILFELFEANYALGS